MRATGLSVQQGPNLLQVRQNSQVTLISQVVQSQAEQLLVKWTKDAVTLRPPYITHSDLGLEVCAQGWLCWRLPGNLILQLDHMSVDNRLSVLLVGAWPWLCLAGRWALGPPLGAQRPRGNALYSNFLYWPRAPKKTEAWPVEGRCWAPQEDQRVHSFYPISFPPSTPQWHLAPKPCPAPVTLFLQAECLLAQGPLKCEEASQPNNQSRLMKKANPDPVVT
ncbi:LOW QUALITY PROTEIN: transmembrane and immunoglobulin domain-containing protein 2 [Molossus nigricans]